MKYEDLSKLSDEALVHHELRLERALLQAQFALRTGQLEDTASVSGFRKDIARARTAQRLREREGGLAKNALRDRHRGTFDPTAAAPSADGGSSSGGFLKGIADRLGLGGDEDAPAQD